MENVAQLNSAMFGTGVNEATQHGADKPRGKPNKQTASSPCSETMIPRSRVYVLSVGQGCQHNGRRNALIY